MKVTVKFIKEHPAGIPEGAVHTVHQEDAERWKEQGYVEVVDEAALAAEAEAKAKAEYEAKEKAEAEAKAKAEKEAADLKAKQEAEAKAKADSKKK